MVAYSKYRRKCLSDNAKAIIVAIVVLVSWSVVSEMDYQEATRTVCEGG